MFCEAGARFHLAAFPWVIGQRRQRPGNVLPGIYGEQLHAIVVFLRKMPVGIRGNQPVVRKFRHAPRDEKWKPRNRIGGGKRPDVFPVGIVLIILNIASRKLAGVLVELAFLVSRDEAFVGICSDEFAFAL